MASIQGIYIALFGRPADPLGLAFFNEATQEGADLTAIGDLAATAEYQDRFEGMNNAQIVTAIYQSLFGRAPELAGLEFFVNALNSGELNINNVAIAILDGAQGADADIVANKETAADAFTAAIAADADLLAAYNGMDGAAVGVSYLAGVTADEASIPTAAQLAAFLEANFDGVPSGGDGLLFNLTVGADTFAPNSNVPENKTTTGDDEFNASAGALETEDLIDGGAGRDTLNAVVDGANEAPTVRNVETINLTTAGAAGILNLANVTGAEEVLFAGATGGFGLTLNGVAKSQLIGYAADEDLTVNYTATSGKADSVSLAIKGAEGTFTANGIETIAVSTEGKANDLTVSGDDAKSITLSGAGATTLKIDGATAAQLETVDASGQTAAVTLTLNGTTEAVEVTGGTGADTIIVDGDVGHTLTGGAGADTFNIDGLTNIAVTPADDDEIAEQVLEITDYGTGNDTIVLDLGGDDVIGLTGTQQAAVDAETTLLDAIETALGQVVQGDNAVLFTYGGDAYIVLSDTDDDTFDAGDGLIKITGAADLTAADIL